VCVDTGVVTIEKVICVDDAGRLISPELVMGQIVGGFAQGVGEAMMEQVHYDADGQLLTGSFMDYAMPRADTVPPLEIHGYETHSPTNLLGAKGVGEAGTIGAPPALLNAVIDALSPLGVEDLQMPMTSHNIWQAIQKAKR
jgi:carbon-monoxide dehydrogenase large subunit